jgi:hypothetical protein
VERRTFLNAPELLPIRPHRTSRFNSNAGRVPSGSSRAECVGAIVVPTRPRTNGVLDSAINTPPAFVARVGEQLGLKAAA